MPFLFDRRSFLKSAAAGIVAPALARAAFAEPKSEVHWALLSDVHIAADAGDEFRGFHPHENLKKVLSEVKAQPCDSILIAGDLARQEGKPADYEALSGLLEPVTGQIPLAIILGNHDDRKNCRSAFASVEGEVQPVEKKFVLAFDAGPMQVILLDSLLATNVVPGQLGSSQRDWLSNYLKSIPSKPAIVVVHHDPDPNDDNGLVDAERFLKIVTSAKNVKSVFYGHTHAWHYEQQDGVHLVNLPAVGYNFKDSEPVGWTEAQFTPAGAKLKLHVIGGDLTHREQVLNLPWRG
jgi:3',5'-cyclic AMP phosphodiesterase CpdA